MMTSMMGLDRELSAPRGAPAPTLREPGESLTSRKCFVGNLSFQTSWQDLKDHFRQAGDVAYANIMQEGGRSKGWGIVEFANADDAVRAIAQLHGKELHGRVLLVREDRELGGMGVTGKRTRNFDPAVDRHGRGVDDEDMMEEDLIVEVGRRVYVGNLSYSVDSLKLKNLFQTAGNVVYADVATEDGGRKSKGYGLVEFESSDEAVNAINQLHDVDLDGRKLIVREDREDPNLKNHASRAAPSFTAPSFKRTNRGAPGASVPPGLTQEITVARRCFVGNLSYRTSWQDLKDHFRQAGEVVYANVMQENGRSKGMGIVEFSSSEEAANAITTLNQVELDGRILLVREDRQDRDLR